ncbi:bifunctional adenosylcobinamide kinase/adenosylcobinamide-phosphate guanylyltransferase [Desulfofustis limnaeus]|jgi:adenosylcobinamide kinase/adenosylcobinamide-phosphate guanylyltransferase|uniref:Adenosylcobinamide kinase n=1 Tax=Desulfofustis limnaeus TaxID=2740163 RepID=A0ABM7W8A9_9BACT|nr:bifunctional adenosylcobinamide kinase/adenosylcobinamide-phosphate guanylyltransferase [Desulfofustis limnaeus]MDX9894787.1 bifunctional adenosylcobinamide kinase/adenosylcobinamide-phosphate guanylyltransferase [Desulfofustis sp.]BDD87153.1 adenosylcobinamide kinase/adenosylcobinamide phosphate guanyltransferase [Desulfofustis limnaeus]
MAELVLVVGGTRSGKSDYAQQRCELLPGSRCFLATCVPLDNEMQDRVARHRLARQTQRWTTVEEPLHLDEAIRSHPDFDVYLVDCLTLWVSNMLLDKPDMSVEQALRALELQVEALLDALCIRQATAVLVSGEVGMGIVPENRLARLFRDLVGRCNQLVAERADEVVLVSCGIPLHLKNRGRSFD